MQIYMLGINIIHNTITWGTFLKINTICCTIYNFSDNYYYNNSNNCSCPTIILCISYDGICYIYKALLIRKHYLTSFMSALVKTITW